MFIEEQSDMGCPGCGKVFSDYQMPDHIQKCKNYPVTILRQVQSLDKTAPPGLIKYLMAEMDLAKKHLRGILDQKANGSNNFMEEEVDQLDLIAPDPNKKNFPSYVDVTKSSKIKQESVPVDISAFDSEIVVCGNCTKKFYANYDIKLLFYVYECWHIFCLPCITKYVDTEFVNQGGNLKCMLPKCQRFITEEQIRSLIGDKKFDALQNKSIRKMCNISQCFKCKEEFQFVQGNYKDAPKKDLNGNLMKEVYAKDYAKNRFVCPKSNCKTQQCKECQASPYHLGMDCKEFKARALLKKCRYCNEPLTQKNTSKDAPPALKDICTAKECKQQSAKACTKTLGCGHSCYGYRNEKTCLPCLNQACAEGNKELNGVNGDEYCAVCYVQALSASPCVRSNCGHIFHVKCLKKRFDIKWLTPRILFNFCLCPLCKKWISVPQQSQLYRSSEDMRNLFTKIQGMALERLKFEQLEKSDEKLTKSTSPYFGKPLEYAMAIYAYFMCFKCKNPYFGGRKNCADAMNQAQNAGGVFKAQELVCPNCCQIPIENCPKHGKDFIEFKCKFCCNTAQWFCWGNTHFCQPCHKKQCSGDYVSKYTKEQLPKCQGAGVCPAGGNHNGNGQQRMLGCAICRNYKENNKGF